jgi:hypothetical protein
MKTNVLPLILTLLVVSCVAYGQTYTFDFSVSDQQFEGGVSDFHVSQSDQHNFTFDNRNFQPPLDTQRLAQYMSGVNPSDDLFMFMKKKITGLQPNTTYDVTFLVEFASIYPTNAFGVGGPPGEGVTMKAGLTLIEPDTIITDKGGSFVTMNIDKGNQSQPGADMDTIGHVGVSDTTTVYTMKTNDNIGHPFTFTTNNTGEAWLIVGTDSGFEAETALYYSSITVDFNITTGTAATLDPDDVMVYPNPSNGTVYVSSASKDFDLIRIYDTSGRLARSYVTKSSSVGFVLPRADYLVKVTSGNSTVVKRLIVQ